MKFEESRINRGGKMMAICISYLNHIRILIIEQVEFIEIRK